MYLTEPLYLCYFPFDYKEIWHKPRLIMLLSNETIRFQIGQKLEPQKRLSGFFWCRRHKLFSLRAMCGSKQGRAPEASKILQYTDGYIIFHLVVSQKKMVTILMESEKGIRSCYCHCTCPMMVSRKTYHLRR